MAKDCSFAYEQQYDPKSETPRVLKKKSNHASNTQAARLGNIIHGALEDWRMPDENGKTPPPKFGRLMMLYDDGKVLLRRWFDRRGKDPIRVYATEQAMGSHANPFMLDNGVPIYGFIDLIVEHKNGAIEVIDYKSNRAPKTQDEADSDVQAGIYLSWAKQMFPDREIRFSFEMLRFGVVTTIWDNKKLDNFKAWLKTQYESIKNKTEGTPEIGDGCRWCSFTTVCPAAQELITKGAFDLVEHEFGSDDEMLGALATIKAAQGILTRRRGSIEREFKDRLDPFNVDEKIVTDGWSVSLTPKEREEYIPSELQKILPPAVFGQITKVTKAAVEKALPILTEDMQKQVRDSVIKKPYNAFTIRKRDAFKDKPKDE